MSDFQYAMSTLKKQNVVLEDVTGDVVVISQVPPRSESIEAAVKEAIVRYGVNAKLYIINVKSK